MNRPERPAGCAQSPLCPLSQVCVGRKVRIKQLSAPPEISHRLRELGFCEEQQVKLVSRQSSFICQVCNLRLGISEELADAIWVEVLPPEKRVA